MALRIMEEASPFFKGIWIMSPFLSNDFFDYYLPNLSLHEFESTYFPSTTYL